MQRPTDSEMRKRAQELRRNATREENHLWYDFLRTHRCQFRRQKRFGYYIVDFYCSQYKLVLELDGSQHYTPESKEHDRQRTQYLNDLGLRVLRFTNLDINERFEAVCMTIDQALTNTEDCQNG